MPVAINVLTKVERGSFKVNCTVVSSSASTSSITFRSTTDPFSAAVSNVNTTSLVVNDSPSENVTSSRSFTVQILLSSSSRSEEHTSELQSRFDLVCRRLLQKKNM